jgi:hypothetical protein
VSVPARSVPVLGVDVSREVSLTQHAPATPDELDQLSDHDLLLGGVVASIAENRAAAEKWARMVAYFRRREADDGARHDESPNFALTARQQTSVEVGELWGLADSWVRRQLNIALCLSEHFGYAWSLCRSGQLDSYRATVVADAARTALETDEEFAAVALGLNRFLARHLKVIPGVELPVVSCTQKQLRNKLNYEIRKLRARDAQQRFSKAYENRAVSGIWGEDGISWMTLTGTTDQIQLARHRLTLAAKQRRADGDQRTLDQLRTDIAMDLLIQGSTAADALPAYARPVINLTVPIQTVMGLSDDPGVLSGGTVIPAGLARVIAQRPGATWHRMLTDAAGRMVELSTERYTPTRAIWEEVVAEHCTCFRSGCDTPATESELDHRLKWPEGATASSNLWPGCKADHKAKHAPGFSITQTETGAFALRTPARFEHPILATLHPVNNHWDDLPPIQHSAAELRKAFALVRLGRDAYRQQPDIEWELGLAG